MSSGRPTEAEVRTQWKNAVDILEKHRVYADATAEAGGELDVLEQSLEGEFTPASLGAATAQFRALLSDGIDLGMTLSFLEPLLFEFMNIVAASATPADDFGSAYSDTPGMLRALYDYHANASTPITIKSRAITYDSSATTSNGTGGSIVGNGAITRLTKDERNYFLEACFVETKTFRCRQDQNSGVKKHAEVFEVIGEVSSSDALLRQNSATTPDYGSGEGSNAFISSLHAGNGAGGSLLRNSSFTTFNANNTPKFTGWDLTGTAGNLTQDTSNTYRGNPGTDSANDASAKFTGSGAATLTLKQTLKNMNIGSLDSDTPYFFRVMFNKTVGTAAGGSYAIRLGSQTVTDTIANLGANWTEVIIPADTNTWFRNFNEASFDVEIEWSGGTGGSLLIDDVILAPYELIDGTYWVMRGNAATHTPWLLDDTLVFTDTGGLPSAAKLQWWWFVTFGAYLPSAGSPVITDP